MIVYDSHRISTLWQVRGSIFPKAILYALPSCVFAYLIKHFNFMELAGEIDGFQNGTIYSGFTYVLGFILVFRTSQSYTRYWIAATAVHTMRAEWFDACGSLIAFKTISKKSEEDTQRFIHRIIRLFGLLHAMALEEIASLGAVKFPLLDIEGLEKRDLKVLATEPAQGRKVEIVSQWIKCLIVQSVDNNLLNVPPPILTRVFQELGTGLVHYHEALQVVIWPFPFPYAQMSAVLIMVYMLVTPVVVALWANQAWYCAVTTLISVVCMKGIDLIAVELENPFGSDANDLPTFSMHQAMNRDLALLVNPETQQPPGLSAKARTTFEDLVTMNNEGQLSLEQYHKHKENEPMLKRLSSVVTDSGVKFGFRRADACFDKSQVQQQHFWQNFSMSKQRITTILNLSQAVPSSSSGALVTQDNTVPSYYSAKEIKMNAPRAEQGREEKQSILTEERSSELVGAASSASLLDGSNRSELEASGCMPRWSDVVHDLSQLLKDHLRQQLEQQEAVYERHLRVAADAVCAQRELGQIPRPKCALPTQCSREMAAGDGVSRPTDVPPLLPASDAESALQHSVSVSDGAEQMLCTPLPGVPDAIHLSMRHQSVT